MIKLDRAKEMDSNKVSFTEVYISSNADNDTFLIRDRASLEADSPSLSEPAPLFDVIVNDPTQNFLYHQDRPSIHFSYICITAQELSEWCLDSVGQN